MPSFSVRETKMAIVADLGSLQRLPAIIGAGHLAELAFTGKDISADRAKEIGLVNDVSARCRVSRSTAARSIAAEIASNSPLVVQGTKAVHPDCGQDGDPGRARLCGGLELGLPPVGRPRSKPSPRSWRSGSRNSPATESSVLIRYSRQFSRVGSGQLLRFHGHRRPRSAPLLLGLLALGFRPASGATAFTMSSA